MQCIGQQLATIWHAHLYPVFCFLALEIAKHLTSTLTLASFFTTNAESAIKLGYMFAD